MYFTNYFLDEEFAGLGFKWVGADATEKEDILYKVSKKEVVCLNALEATLFTEVKYRTKKYCTALRSLNNCRVLSFKMHCF